LTGCGPADRAEPVHCVVGSCP